MYIITVCKQLQRITIQGLQNGTQFNIFDCRGLRHDDNATCKDILEEDLKKVINGHIMKDYKVLLHTDRKAITKKIHILEDLLDSDIFLITSLLFILFKEAEIHVYYLEGGTMSNICTFYIA